MYPMLRDGVSLGSIYYEDSEDYDYFAENYKGEEFIISESLYTELLDTDGTRPFKNNWAIGELKAAGIIQTSRFVWEGLINRFILLPIGQRARRAKCICGFINAILPYLSFASITVGIVAKMLDQSSMEMRFHDPLYYALMIISILLHESGHFCAVVKNDCDVSDIGLLLLGIIPVGAYVAFQENCKCDLKVRLQIALAGIEMNLFLAGFFLVLSTCISAISFTLLVAAIMNVALLILNLLPSPGLDGEAALSAVLDVKCFSHIAKKVLLNKRTRAYIARKGVTGYIFLSLCMFVYIAQVFIILLIAQEMAHILMLIF